MTAPRTGAVPGWIWLLVPVLAAGTLLLLDRGLPAPGLHPSSPPGPASSSAPEPDLVIDLSSIFGETAWIGGFRIDSPAGPAGPDTAQLWTIPGPDPGPPWLVLRGAVLVSDEGEVLGDSLPLAAGVTVRLRTPEGEMRLWIDRVDRMKISGRRISHAVIRTGNHAPPRGPCPCGSR